MSALVTVTVPDGWVIDSWSARIGDIRYWGSLGRELRGGDQLEIDLEAMACEV